MLRNWREGSSRLWRKLLGFCQRVKVVKRLAWRFGLMWTGKEGEGLEQGDAKAQYEDFVLDMVGSEQYPHKVVHLEQDFLT